MKHMLNSWKRCYEGPGGKGLNFTTDYRRIPIVRGEQDKSCLELPKSSKYADYDNLEHTITYIVRYTHCVYNTVLDYQFIH